jgi:signal peptidase I
VKTARLILQPLAIAFILALATRATVRIYSIPSASMAPTLQTGDHIVVTPYRLDRPQRGDIVVFRAPGAGDELMVKRIIGVPGDLVEARAGRVTVGGHALAEAYLLTPASTGSVAPQIVPADCYFVLGDNRSDSFDSRNWGVLPRHLVVGRTRLILWSSGDGNSAPRASAATRSLVPARAPSVRFDRLFKPVE